MLDIGPRLLDVVPAQAGTQAERRAAMRVKPTGWRNDGFGISTWSARKRFR